MPGSFDLKQVYYKTSLKAYLDRFARNYPDGSSDYDAVIEEISSFWKENGFVHPAILTTYLTSERLEEGRQDLASLAGRMELSRFYPLERLTGFYEKSHLDRISSLGHLYALSTGRPAAMIEVDFSNMGGTNTYFRETIAYSRNVGSYSVPMDEAFRLTDRVARVFCDRIRILLKERGFTNIYPVRAGGDELRIIVPDMDDKQQKAISNELNEMFEEISATLNLMEHPHRKYPSDPYRKGFGAACVIVDMGSMDPGNVSQEVSLRLEREKLLQGYCRKGEAAAEAMEADRDEAARKKARYDKLKEWAASGLGGFLSVLGDLENENLQKLFEVSQREPQETYHEILHDALGRDITDYGLFMDPEQRRMHVLQAILDARNIAGKRVENIYIEIMKEATLRDPATGTWMDGADFRETATIFINDRNRLFAQENFGDGVTDMAKGFGTAVFGDRNAHIYALGFSFKNLSGLNSLVGHDAADVILARYAGVVREALAEEGFVEDDYRLASLGGGNFIVLATPFKTAGGSISLLDDRDMSQVTGAVMHKVNELSMKKISAIFNRASGSGRDDMVLGDIPSGVTHAPWNRGIGVVSTVLKDNDAGSYDNSRSKGSMLISRCIDGLATACHIANLNSQISWLSVQQKSFQPGSSPDISL